MSVTQRIFAAIREYTAPSTAADPIESLRGTFDQWTRENGDDVVVDVAKVDVDVASHNEVVPEKETEKKEFRPDLEHGLQKTRYAFDKERARLNYLNNIARETEKSDDFSRVAVKGLLDEAFRLYAARHKDDDDDADFFEFRWESLAKDVMKDFEVSGPQTVMGNLSCMSLFIAGHEADLYGPNTENRVMRLERQKKVLQRIKASSERARTAL